MAPGNDDPSPLISDNAFSVQVSMASELSRTVTSTLDTDSYSRQCTDIDRMVSTVVNEVLVSKAVRVAVRDCRFCVTIANPRGDDCPLIAVSEEFEAMTGYTRGEILGVNCRFLNQGCDMDPGQLMGLRFASRTGAPFTAMLQNRKKSGELFLNLLDLRGLTVARDLRTGEDLWFLIGIQADVSDLAEDAVPEDHLEELQLLSDLIRVSIKKELSELAVSSCNDLPSRPSHWQLLEKPEWRPEAPNGQAANKHESATSSTVSPQRTAPLPLVMETKAQVSGFAPSAEQAGHLCEARAWRHDFREAALLVLGLFTLGAVAWLSRRRRSA